MLYTAGWRESTNRECVHGFKLGTGCLACVNEELECELASARDACRDKDEKIRQLTADLHRLS